MTHMLEHVLEHAFLDSIKLVPFLFLTYFVMELLEHKTAHKVKGAVKKAGKLGPLFGGVLGVMPQCGFSAAASSLYAARVISVGTLMAIFLSTSDEMLPIMISKSVDVVTIVKILTCKVFLAVLSGFIVELLYHKVLKKEDKNIDIHKVCEEDHCRCEDGPVFSAFRHTLHIFIYLFIITMLLNLVIEGVGEDKMASLLTGIPVVGELIAAVIGLIPNCASSVIITELYLDGIIHAGAMMSGLMVNAGVGLLVLFRMNHHWKENISILGALYGIGVFWGVIIEVFGITFLGV